MEIPFSITMLGYRVDRFEYQPMHLLGLLCFLMIAFFWVAHGLRIALGAIELPWLKDSAAARDADCPAVSLLFAARDEAEKLPAALETLRAIDYPGLEIVAVNDRSTDGTKQILSNGAKSDPRLRVVSIEALPEGWLGKPHALQRAFEASSSEWLLFTDADVRFRSDAIRRAVTLATTRQLDHLTLMCELEMHGFWEKTILTFFGLGFHLATNPPAVSNPRSRAYIGIGAFQLIKRSVYQASGTHRRLAMEVLDDMKLGKIVKLSGFRSAVGIAQDYVTVRWHAGFRNIIGGVTKNFFAGAEFKLRVVGLQLAGLFLANILPFLALPFVHGWTLLLAGASIAIAAGYHAATAWVMRASPLYALTHPIGAAIFGYMLLRSTMVTLRQGGIVWRDTFYPLEQLRRGLV
jgi:glycosyltransferase involved in cell wall biosynthesis